MNNRRGLTIEGLESRWQKHGKDWLKPTWWWTNPKDFIGVEEQVLARETFHKLDKMDDPLQRIAVWKMVVRLNRLVQERPDRLGREIPK